MCSSIRIAPLKALCYGLDSQSSQCSAALDDHEKDAVKETCNEWVDMGRKLRGNQTASGRCSVDDDVLDAWCDATHTLTSTACNGLPSSDRRSCAVALEVLTAYKAQGNWDKVATAVTGTDPSETRGREIATGPADWRTMSCSRDLSIAPLPPGVEQKKYTPQQYAQLWAKHQGHSMTNRQLRTVTRGCIGIVAANLTGGGDPLDDAEALFGDFAAAEAYMNKGNRLLDWLGDTNNPAARWMVGDEDAKRISQSKVRYVVFGKLFWSNQRGRDRSKPDPDAFPVDPTTSEIDLEDFIDKYDYEPRPDGEWVNFDYGFWDEAGQVFWHANHGEYDDPELRKSDPMIVLASTKSVFSGGYEDFDRVVFGVALAEAFEAKSTATFWARKQRR
jgi:hypothetical protein